MIRKTGTRNASFEGNDLLTILFYFSLNSARVSLFVQYLPACATRHAQTIGSHPCKSTTLAQEIHHLHQNYDEWGQPYILPDIEQKWRFKSGVPGITDQIARNLSQK